MTLKPGLASVLLVLAGMAAPLEAGNKYALLIGLNVCQVPKVARLNFALADARAVKEALIAVGYDEDRITILPNEEATRGAILRALSYYALTLGSDDDFLLFYSGHGVRNTVINGKTYWLTFAAGLSDLDSSAIRLQHLMDYVRDIKARRKLVLLDHCYAGEVVEDLAGGASAPGAGGTTPGTPRDGEPRPLELKGVQLSEDQIEREIEGRGLVVFTAARNQALEDASLQHGVFTHTLLRALTTREADLPTDAGDGNLSIAELFTFLKNENSKTLARFAPGFSQIVDDFTEGVDTAGWLVATGLPLGTAAEALRKKEQYERRLTRWQLMDPPLISHEVEIHCLDTLSRWAAAARDGTELTPPDQGILQGIRLAMEGTDGTETSRAKSLELRVREIRGM